MRFLFTFYFSFEKNLIDVIIFRLDKIKIHLNYEVYTKRSGLVRLYVIFISFPFQVPGFKFCSQVKTVFLTQRFRYLSIKSHRLCMSVFCMYILWFRWFIHFFCCFLPSLLFQYHNNDNSKLILYIICIYICCWL